MKKFLKTYLIKWWVITILTILVVILGFVIVYAFSQPAQYSFIKIKPTTVSEGVSVTGKVTSATSVDLGFEKTGQVTSVNKNVGDRVSPGDVIVVLDNGDVRAQLSQAVAQVAYQQAKLDELQKGTRPEELQISQTKLQAAQTSFDQAKTNLLSSLQAAYSSTEDAIHNKTDEFFVNPRTSNPQLAFAQTVTTETSIGTGRVEVEARLDDMISLLSAATTSSDLPSLSNSIKQDIAEAKLFLDNTALAVNALTTTSGLSQPTISQWKSDLATARNEVNSAITSVLIADSSFSSAQSAVTLANNQLSLDQAGNVADDIKAQQAQVDEMQANVSSIRAELAKTYIRSPISGIVTKEDAKIGQLAVANTPLVSIISDAQFQIDANIAEADIAKVAVGQKASVTLDAYGSDVTFLVSVISIDPAETIIDGVPTYKTTFQFDQSDDRIKSGMTANIDIQGESHQNVLAVPERAVITHNGNKYVRVQSGKTIQEVPVQTGLRGVDGQVEITSGLHAGDSVAITIATS